MINQPFFLSLAAALLISTNAFAQSAAPISAPSSRLAITSQAPTDSAKTKVTTIRIFCGSSIKPGQEPLFIVNGQPIEDKKIKTLDPNNIDKIAVLQGDRATAFYGSRARYGAVIISVRK